MAEDEIYQLKRHIEHEHGGRATLMRSIPLHETVDGHAWEGLVHVFELTGCPGAIRAYAWLASAGGRQRPYAVLHSTRVSSPRKAVHETLAARELSQPRLVRYAK